MTRNPTTRSKSGPLWRRGLFFGFSLTITLVVFRILFRRIHWTDVATMLVEVDKRWLVVFLGLSFGMLALRTWRYRIILRASRQNPPVVPLFLVVVVRGMCVDMLPARLGELVYIFLARTRLGLDLGASTASFALAFLFDLLALAPLVLAGAWALAVGRHLPVTGLLLGGGILLGASLALIHTLPTLIRFGRRLLRPCTARSLRWAEFLDQTAASVDESLTEARACGIYGALFGVSLLVRVAKYAALYVVMLALLAPRGIGWEDLPVASTFMALVSGEMAASLPVSGLGGFGAYEGTLALVLGLFGFGAGLAAAVSISHRVLTQVYGLCVGLLALAILMLPVFHRGPSGQRN